MPSLTTINNFFQTRKNQFEPNIFARFYRTNPFVAMFKRGIFNLEGGRVPEVITSTYELPTSYPFGLTNPSLSNGTGDPACTVPAVTIKSGNKVRSYQLEQAAFDTDVICLTDIQFSYQASQQASNKEKGLQEYATVWMGDWYRVHNIGMLNRKASTTSSTAISEKSDSLYDFSTLALPTFELNWLHLNGFYDMCIRRGMGEFSIGNAGGMPTFTIVSGPGYKRELFQNEEQVRDTINLSPLVLENFTARGITKAVNGYAPSVDDFPIRYAADGTTPIYPTINQDTSTGRESVLNPAYKTAANGGSAVYEVVTILCRDIYGVDVRPVGPLAAGKAKFDATNYAGEVNWINNKDMANNPLGNKGFYRMDFQMAAKPMYPEFGISILTLAKD